ncbi:MAG: hypothetical protein DHS20C01_20500 [marine bacterium B5-7]|nr:MAG: hypothetical protein DHS20C01_20500 [marine bacterium B5-7]
MLIVASALLIGLFGISGISSSDGNNLRDDNDAEYQSIGTGKIVLNSDYVEECGACHLAYPAQLLPADSWRQIMFGLADHFGENAELSVGTRDELLGYLLNQAADGPLTRRKSKLLRGLDGPPPLRITELAYFRDTHDEIPIKMVKDNPDVRSFSNCDSCHKSAARGEFDEDNVVIAGYGRWHD